MKLYTFVKGILCAVILCTEYRPVHSSFGVQRSQDDFYLKAISESLSSLRQIYNEEVRTRTIGDEPIDIVASYVSINNIFEVQNYTDVNEFLASTGYNGTQKIRIGIFDYEFMSAFSFTLSTLLELATQNVIYITLTWEGMRPLLMNRTDIGGFSEFLEQYEERKSQVVPAAEYLVNMLGEIQANSGFGLDLSNVVLFTSGLGGHVAGLVGKAIPGIGKIIAHNPAAVGYETAALDDRLDETDAIHVTVVHSMLDEYGLQIKSGHVDIFILADPPIAHFFPYAMLTYHPFLSGIETVETLYEHISTTGAFLPLPGEDKSNRSKRQAVEEILADIGTFLPRAYKCKKKNRFLNGKYNFRENIPLPMTPFVDIPETAGDYYHLVHSFNTQDYFSNIPQEATFLLGQSFPVPSMHIKVVAIPSSTASYGYLEAQIIFDNMIIRDPFSNATKVFSTEFLPILDLNDDRKKGISLFTAPFSLTDDSTSQDNIRFVTRFRRKPSIGSIDETFVVKEIAFMSTFTYVNDQEIAVSEDLILRHCNAEYSSSFETLELQPIRQRKCS